MSSFEQSTRDGSPELCFSPLDLYTDGYEQVDHGTIDRRYMTPAVSRGNVETILPADPLLPISKRPRREDDLIFVFTREKCREMRFKPEEEEEEEKEEEDDDVIYVTTYRGNSKKMRFKTEENIQTDTDDRAEERAPPLNAGERRFAPPTSLLVFLILGLLMCLFLCVIVMML